MEKTASSSVLEQIFDLAWEAEQCSLVEKIGIQSAHAFLMLSRARRLSRYVLEEGAVSSLDGLSLSRDPLLEARGMAHMQRVLDFLLDNPRCLDRFRAPVCNEQVRILICESLRIDPESTIDDFEVRWAVLSALMFPLRQVVGSCFASAPAILIQSEQIPRFLDDMFDMLVLGKIRRTRSGNQYSVPISVTWGLGDLLKPITEGFIQSQFVQDVFENTPSPFASMSVRDYFQKNLSQAEAGRAEAVFKSQVDHALLKSWEYTIASFADCKADFARWNLFASLGLDHKEVGGIGEAIYSALEIKLEESNEKLQELAGEHDLAIGRVQMSQSLLSQAYDRDRRRRHQTELSMNLHHLDQVKDMIGEVEQVAKHMSGFYVFLVEHFQEKLTEYFQEVYDPQIHEENTEIYDDSPAGFRLVFKHGRDDPSLWTAIYDKEGFVNALAQFFGLIEADTIHSCDWEEGKDLVNWMISLVITRVRDPLFVETAFQRMQKAHQPIEGVSSRTPWSYIAGGSLESLIKTYYGFEGDFTKEERSVDSPMDLCVFLIDLFKEAAPDLTDPFVERPDRGLLMYTPTHACILRPGLPAFMESWKERGFTYTWLRDRYVESARMFYMGILLHPEEQKHLLALMGEDPSVVAHRGITPHEFRMEIVRGASRLRQDQIDGFLRFAFPLFRRDEWRLEASIVLQRALKNAHLEKAEAYLEGLHVDVPFLTRNQFLDVLQSVVLHVLGHGFYTPSLNRLVDDPMPRLLPFADTNWPYLDFAFGYNPGSDGLDLWRVHQGERFGVPMSDWRAYFDGTKRAPWGVLMRPFEYGGGYTRTDNIPGYKI